MIDIDVIDAVETPIGNIFLHQRPHPNKPGVTVCAVNIDGALLMSSLNPVSERQLATSALTLKAGEEGIRVLVGGLGLGYTAEAALAHAGVASVRVVDKMDFVIGWLRRGLLPLSEQLNADDRLEVVQGDIYQQLLGPADETYDVILVDVDHSPEGPLDPASRPFYTKAGQGRVAAHLAPGGVLAVWSATDNDAFAAVMDASYPKAHREHVRWDNEPGEECSDPLHNVLFIGRL